MNRHREERGRPTRKVLIFVFLVCLVLLSTLITFIHITTTAITTNNDSNFLIVEERNRGHLRKDQKAKAEDALVKEDHDDRSQHDEHQHFAIIVGAGAAGLCAAHTLRYLGFDDVIILEASTGLGGRVKKDESFTDFPIDLGASIVYPPKKYRQLSGRTSRTIRIKQVPGAGPILENYTWYDFLADYIAPPPEQHGIVYGCQVESIDYRSTRSGVEVTCRNNNSNSERTFVADYAVVTVPLSVLKEGDIEFNPPLPSAVAENNPRDMWEGFKIFIEFSNKFYNSSFCFKDRDGYCEGDYGEIFFWDYSHVHRSSKKNVLAGYIVGEPAMKYVKKSDSKILAKVLRLLDTRFHGKAKENYVKHLVMNWSNEPYIRGAYSNEVEGLNQTGAENVNDKVFLAGEAFPIQGDEHGWVHTAMNSGDDAAKKILLSRKKRKQQNKRKRTQTSQ